MLRENYATWLVGSHELSLARPRIMGILDVTPEAFPDGKGGVDVKAAAERGLDMLDEGADIVDVAAVPAAPGQEPLASNEEAERVVPVIRALVAEGAVVSVNTCHPDVAKMCVRLGAAIVNDANGFTSPDMVQVAAETDCGCVVMHWEHEGLGSHAPRREVLLDDSRPTRSAAPRPMASQHRFTLPDEAPIMRQVMGFLGDQARTLMRAGVAHDRICLDPGAGFDKFADEDVVIQRATRSMASMGYPLLAAVSRRRFVGAVAGAAQPDEMDAATYGICVSAIQNGARILRVHDVAGAAQAVNAFWAVSHKDSRQGFVALGSNVGDRLANITRAVQLIEMPWPRFAPSCTRWCSWDSCSPWRTPWDASATPSRQAMARAPSTATWCGSRARPMRASASRCRTRGLASATLCWCPWRTSCTTPCASCVIPASTWLIRMTGLAT